MGPLLVTLALLPRPVLSGAEQTVNAGAGFKIHYTLEGQDVPLGGGADVAPPNGVPDDIDAVSEGLSRAERTWIRAPAAMRAPLPDGTLGGDGRVDVYVRKLDGPRGYTHAEDVAQGPAASAWIELDPRSAAESGIRLAAAAEHEAFHAIENAYSIGAPAWLREACATWVELHDFTLEGEMAMHLDAIRAHPEVPLDAVDGRHEYDEAAFIDFLVEDKAAEVLPRVWSEVALDGDAAGAVSRLRSSSMAAVLFAFGGRLYPYGAGPDRTSTLVLAGVPRTLPLPPLSLLRVRSEYLSACSEVQVTVGGDGTFAIGPSWSSNPEQPPADVTLSFPTYPFDDGYGGANLLLARGPSAATQVSLTLQSTASSPCDFGLLVHPADACGCTLGRRRDTRGRGPAVAIALGLAALRLLRRSRTVVS